MEYEEFEEIDDNLLDHSKSEKNFNMMPVKIEESLNKMNISNDKGLIINFDKIQILKNGEWHKDTYIKLNGDIKQSDVRKYVEKLEPDYYTDEVNYEFHGGPPMGTVMFDYREIEGENVWVVNLKPRLKSYLKNNGKIGDIENFYYQLGGNKKSFQLGGSEKSLNEEIIETINRFFNIQDVGTKERLLKEKYDKVYYQDVSQTNTHFDGQGYYTTINIFKDGKYIDKVSARSKLNPISWRVIIDKILTLNKNSNFYGYIYKLSSSFNKGLILETTDDYRYRVDYECME